MDPIGWLLGKTREHNRQRELACLETLVELDWAHGATAAEILDHASRRSKLVTSHNIHSVLSHLGDANQIVMLPLTDAQRNGRESRRFRITQAGRNQVAFNRPQD